MSSSRLKHHRNDIASFAGSGSRRRADSKEKQSERHLRTSGGDGHRRSSRRKSHEATRSPPRKHSKDAKIEVARESKDVSKGKDKPVATLEKEVAPSLPLENNSAKVSNSMEETIPDWKVTFSSQLPSAS